MNHQNKELVTGKLHTLMWLFSSLSAEDSVMPCDGYKHLWHAQVEGGEVSTLVQCSKQLRIAEYSNLRATHPAQVTSIM